MGTDQLISHALLFCGGACVGFAAVSLAGSAARAVRWLRALCPDPEPNPGSNPCSGDSAEAPVDGPTVVSALRDGRELVILKNKALVAFAPLLGHIDDVEPAVQTHGHLAEKTLIVISGIDAKTVGDMLDRAEDAIDAHNALLSRMQAEGICRAMAPVEEDGQ